MTAIPEATYRAIASESDMDDLSRSQAPETLYLEFKRKSDARDGVLNDTDKKNFSKALSAFANGGVGLVHHFGAMSTLIVDAGPPH